MMDQLAPEEISRIVITPPAPGTNPLRGWSVRAWRRDDDVVPNESYCCDTPPLALDLAAKLLAGEKVELADCYSPLSPGGRPHAAR